MIEREYKDYGATTYTAGGQEFVSVSSIVGRWHSYGMERYKLRLAVQGGRDYPNLELDRVIGIVMRDGGEAARHGKEVHSLLERFDLGGGKKDPLATPFETEKIDAWEDVVGRHQLSVIAAEQLVCNPALGYAGRFDRLLASPRFGNIITDFKTGKMSLEYVLQQAAYANCTHLINDDGTIEPIVGPVNQDHALIVTFPKDGKPTKVYVADLAGAFDAFKQLLKLHEYEAGRRKAAGRPWEELAEDVPNEVSIDELVAAFEAEKLDSVEQYRLDSWEYLRNIVRGYGERERQQLALLWPAGVPTFKKVSSGVAEVPTLLEIEQVELAMTATDSACMIQFRDVLTRPLPPPHATIEECPPIHFRIDVPHAQRVAEVQALFAKLTPKQKARYKLPQRSKRPHLPTRSDIPPAVAHIEELLAEPPIQKAPKTT